MLLERFELVTSRHLQALARTKAATTFLCLMVAYLFFISIFSYFSIGIEFFCRSQWVLEHPECSM